MAHAVLVFLGGGLGSLLRWGCGLACARVLGTAFPYGTLVVNVLGALVMGILARVLLVQGSALPDAGAAARLLLMTGFLGGFTTFSAFSLEVFQLWQRGEAGLALLYVGVSLGLSVAMVVFGYGLGGFWRGG